MITLFMVLGAFIAGGLLAHIATDKNDIGDLLEDTI